LRSRDPVASRLDRIPAHRCVLAVRQFRRRGRVIYIYPAGELLAFIRAAVSEVGIERGKGNSNKDTFAVLVPNPAWRWTGSDGQPWQWIGDGEEHAAINAIRTALNTRSRSVIQGFGAFAGLAVRADSARSPPFVLTMFDTGASAGPARVRTGGSPASARSMSDIRRHSRCPSNSRKPKWR
jgi:hypothetical protein